MSLLGRGPPNLGTGTNFSGSRGRRMAWVQEFKASLVNLTLPCLRECKRSRVLYVHSKCQGRSQQQDTMVDHQESP